MVSIPLEETIITCLFFKTEIFLSVRSYAEINTKFLSFRQQILVNSNAIPMSRINDAVRRILRVKFVMGLFENPLADDRFVNELGSQVN